VVLWYWGLNALRTLPLEPHPTPTEVKEQERERERERDRETERQRQRLTKDIIEENFPNQNKF
jgi:hypothetical protein